MKLWEVNTGRRLDTFSQPLKEQAAVAFSPDGKLVAAGGSDNRLRVWKVSQEAVEGTNQLVATRFAHEGSLRGVSFDPGGRQIFTSAARPHGQDLEQYDFHGRASHGQAAGLGAGDGGAGR